LWNFEGGVAELEERVGTDSVDIVVAVLAEILSVVRKSAESSLPVVDKHAATFGSPRTQERTSLIETGATNVLDDPGSVGH
jgi:hypothetical protein